MNGSVRHRRAASSRRPAGFWPYGRVLPDRRCGQARASAIAPAVCTRAGESAAAYPRPSALGGAAAENDHRGMRIDRYQFGMLVADGHEIHTDVLLTPGEVQEHWWRREGHVLHLEDLAILLEGHPEWLVVGTGAYGRMRPAAGLEQELAARGVVVEVLPTPAAVDRINELLRCGGTGWAAALHLTC
jgi:hypothetical protein